MPFAVFRALKQHVHEVAGVDGDLAGLVDEFFDGNDPFGLEADIHHDFGRGDFHHRALDDLTFREVAEAGIVQFHQTRKLLRVHVGVGVHGGKARAARFRFRRLAVRLRRLVYIAHCGEGPPSRP